MTLTLSGLSYAIVRELDQYSGAELTGIKCLICERTSWYIQDVKNLYCGNCKVFHKDYVPLGLRAPFIYKKAGLLKRLWRTTDPLRQRLVRWLMKSNS